MGSDGFINQLKPAGHHLVVASLLNCNEKWQGSACENPAGGVVKTPCVGATVLPPNIGLYLLGLSLTIQ